jgi:hypothetical protein
MHTCHLTVGGLTIAAALYLRVVGSEAAISEHPQKETPALGGRRHGLLKNPVRSKTIDGLDVALLDEPSLQFRGHGIGFAQAHTPTLDKTRGSSTAINFLCA